MSRTAVLTRPGKRNTALAMRLEQAGWTVLCAPALDIVRLEVADIHRYLPQHYDLIVFVSGNAVHAYASALAADSALPTWPATSAIAGVGSATVQAASLALRLPPHTPRYGPSPEAASYDSEALYATLQRAHACAGRVLIVRGTTGRDWLADRLRADGAAVDTLAVYARSPATWPDQTCRTLQAWQAQGRATIWLYTTVEGLAAIDAQVRRCGVSDWWASSDAVLTHPRLVPAWRACSAHVGRSASAGFKVCLPDDDAIFEAFVAV